MSDILVPMLRVTNEEEAFELLRQALAGDLPLDVPPSIDFHGWPRLGIHLPKTPVDASISPTMMEAFIEVQTAIYRVHSLLTTDSGDLRGLTKAEKDTLEFRVKVDKGSSEYLADLVKPIETIGASVVSKMTSVEVFISVLVVALLTASVIGFKAWLKTRAEQRRDEVHRDEVKALLQAQADALKHDERQTAILTQAFQRRPVLEDVEAALEPARQSVLKAVGDEGGGTIQGIDISPAVAAEINSQRRQQSVVESMSGVYRVAKVDTTVPDGFRVTFANIENGEEIAASLQDAIVSEDHREIIRRAEWSKRPVRVWFRVKKLRNRYIDAVVVDVKDIEPTPRAAS